MKHLVVAVLVVLVGCGGARSTTIRGEDLYAHASHLRQHGRALVPTSGDGAIVVREDQYLVDRSRAQVFVVRDVVEGCYGRTLEIDTECTLALMRGQHFVVTDVAPTPRGESKDLSGASKVRLGLAAATAAMAIGAATCDDGPCGSLLGIGAAATGLVLLISYTGLAR